jgi:hypothetical protein
MPYAPEGATGTKSSKSKLHRYKLFYSTTNVVNSTVKIVTK